MLLFLKYSEQRGKVCTWNVLNVWSANVSKNVMFICLFSQYKSSFEDQCNVYVNLAHCFFSIVKYRRAYYHSIVPNTSQYRPKQIWLSESTREGIKCVFPRLESTLNLPFTPEKEFLEPKEEGPGVKTTYLIYLLHPL